MYGLSPMTNFENVFLAIASCGGDGEEERRTWDTLTPCERVVALEVRRCQHLRVKPGCASPVLAQLQRCDLWHEMLSRCARRRRFGVAGTLSVRRGLSTIVSRVAAPPQPDHSQPAAPIAAPTAAPANRSSVARVSTPSPAQAPRSTRHRRARSCSGCSPRRAAAEGAAAEGGGIAQGGTATV